MASQWPIRVTNILQETVTGSLRKTFPLFDYIVCPSGSCTLHIKDHLHDDKNETGAKHIRRNIYELTEFITDILKVTSLNAKFPYKVGMHQSCHGQRGLAYFINDRINGAVIFKATAIIKNGRWY